MYTTIIEWLNEWRKEGRKERDLGYPVSRLLRLYKINIVFFNYSQKGRTAFPTIPYSLTNYLNVVATVIIRRWPLFIRLFLVAKFRPKEKISKMNWFWRFLMARSEKKKIRQISIFGYQIASKSKEGWLLSVCTSYLRCSHIWLNLLRDACHFFFIFQWMIAILATIKNS
jgi:hypothetical protein